MYWKISRFFKNILNAAKNRKIDLNSELFRVIINYSKKMVDASSLFQLTIPHRKEIIIVIVENINFGKSSSLVTSGLFKLKD